MQQVKIRIEGKVPLLMHNNQTANPLNVYTKAIKSISSKRKKTDADHMDLSRLEWEAGLYLDDDGHICIPANVIEATLKSAAKKNKNGKAVELGVRVEENFCQLEYPNNGFQRKALPKKPEDLPSKELDKMYDKHVDCRIVTVDRKKILRSRPRFDKWAVEFTLLFDESVINERTLLETVAVAGDQIGMCDYRPRYGLFNAVVV